MADFKSFSKSIHIHLSDAAVLLSRIVSISIYNTMRGTWSRCAGGPGLSSLFLYVGIVLSSGGPQWEGNYDVTGGSRASLTFRECYLHTLQGQILLLFAISPCNLSNSAYLYSRFVGLVREMRFLKTSKFRFFFKNNNCLRTAL